MKEQQFEQDTGKKPADILIDIVIQFLLAVVVGLVMAVVANSFVEGARWFLNTSRIDSFDVAVRKAERSGISLEGSVVASDAFFPFDDAVEAAVSAGAKAIIQPGGSVRDNEVVDAANKSGVAMILTGFRVFRH